MNIKQHFIKNNLLTLGGNAKIDKNDIPTYNLSLLPHTLNSKKENLCTYSTAECRAACLNMAGKGAFASVQNARSLRTEFFVQHRKEFLIVLTSELARINSLYKRALIRLNTFTDINWKKEFANVNINIEDFVNLTFYGYTKNPLYVQSAAKNEEYVYSYSGKNWKQCEAFLEEKKCNVAVVFGNELPEMYKGFKVIPGDTTDERLREKEGTGFIVGLKYKKPKGIKPLLENFVVKV